MLSAMNTVPEALADVGHAFRHLEFAVRLMCYCELNHLDLERFDSDVSILLERENVAFPSGTFATTQATVSAAQAVVGVCFGVSAIVLDAAFDVAGLKNRPASRLDADELRTLVRMVRCAFAHNPAMPVWEARGNDYSRELSFVLGDASLSVDLASFHGQAFEYNHLGGFANWLRIRDAAVSLISAAQ
jgi:hypothetical protein